MSLIDLTIPPREKDLGGFFRQQFHIAQAILRMEHLQAGP